MERTDWEVFQRYKHAPGHAFSNNIVTEQDKDSYQRIFAELVNSVEFAIAKNSFNNEFKSWNCRFYRDGGIQGQRPTDLWASIINDTADSFERFPQVYVIANERGLEIGFSVSIHEDDYYNADLKLKNREIVPLINAKLPRPDSDFTRKLETQLRQVGNWFFAKKNRLSGKSDFDSLSDLLAHLKSRDAGSNGGGTIGRFYSIDDIFDENSTFSLSSTVNETFSIFLPLMKALRKTNSDSTYLATKLKLISVESELETENYFELGSYEDARKKTLRSIVLRRGQAGFRNQLLQAYDFKCAITGCDVTEVLEAAHIVPYNGELTNHIQNGILLRADVHALFDLRLIEINQKYEIKISDQLLDSEYGKYDKLEIRLPKKSGDRPSLKALEARNSKI
ncbi:HNH endonuclease [Pseudaquidulcibacter saccharophilus]|uniref:HNH endonuclease n=1 Tax=Pseudaquidulcibacter saccharophilus TaxID=2831900 RepID=UPI001EFF471D|nr:HNH endonuclease signature motif containing protein [Pseudaquidulcibacter saccharophilus]